MKTTQIIERPFYNGIIQQDHKTGWMNTNQLLVLGNSYRKSIGKAPARLQHYLETEKTKEFIQEIMEQEKIVEVKKGKKGRYGGTWMHPLLFIDFAMYINPAFKYEAMNWLMDQLLQYRDCSGESYKAMGHAISDAYGIYGKVGTVIPKIAKQIKLAVGVDDWNKTTEENLKRRDEIHKKIIFGVQLKAPLDTVLKQALL